MPINRDVQISLFVKNKHLKIELFYLNYIFLLTKQLKEFE